MIFTSYFSISDSSEDESVEPSLKRSSTAGNHGMDSTNLESNQISGPVATTELTVAPPLNNQSTFDPIYLPSEWIEPVTTRANISSTVLVPSGVEPKMITARVMRGGRLLELKIDWPKKMQDLSILHRKWLTAEDHTKIESYHPKMLAFGRDLKQIRKSVDENVSSVGKVRIRFPVQTSFQSKSNLGWVSKSTRVLYIDLKADEEDYGIVKDENSFDMIS